MTRSHRALANTLILLSITLASLALDQQDDVVSFVFQPGHPFYSGVGQRWERRKVTFNPPFLRTPRVVLSLKALDVDKDTNLRINTIAEGLSKDGFTLVLYTWADTKVYEAHVQWLAYLK